MTSIPSMTPRETVAELDKHIVGQTKAKRAVAIALRDRWRRAQLKGIMQEKIIPKNILMIGPTGVGKTEIARWLARIADAPFLKIEATKYTEVGYVGRDVESMIRELADIAMKKTREDEMNRVRYQAMEAAQERILDTLVPQRHDPYEDSPKPDSAARQKFRKMLEDGELDDKEIEIELAAPSVGVEIMAPPGMEEMTSQLQNMFHSLSSDRTKMRKLKVKDALQLVQNEEASKLVNEEELRTKAINSVEQRGIIFIDEIDKITSRTEARGADVSREGVQRDLLPLIEGCTVSTKIGPIKTDHILFIASGAFHHSKPSDLIAELQGRLPIRVELNALSVEDFTRILTEPEASLTEQYIALLSTEQVTIDYTEDAIQRIAEIAWHVNETTVNIGARRLYTVMERLLEHISFEASDRSGEKLTINTEYVNSNLNALLKDEDLSHYIL